LAAELYWGKSDLQVKQLFYEFPSHVSQVEWHVNGAEQVLATESKLEKLGLQVLHSLADPPEQV
jgi:hypothetical protein